VLLVDNSASMAKPYLMVNYHVFGETSANSYRLISNIYFLFYTMTSTSEFINYVL